MANECVIAKFNGTLQNDNLTKLGEIKGTWKLINTEYNRIQISTSGGEIVSCTNVPYFMDVVSGGQKSNPFTAAANSRYDLYLDTQGDTGVLSIHPRYGLQELMLANLLDINVTVDEILETCLSLTKIGFHKVAVRGNLMKIAQYNDIAYIALSNLNKEDVGEFNVRTFINTLAQKRSSGYLSLIATNGNLSDGALVDIPVGVAGTYMGGAACVIYFDGNYTDGWYVRSNQGVYYNSAGEVITP